MTALEDAAQAVDDARERLIGWTLTALPNEPGFAGAERRADALVAAVRHHDAETVREFADQEDGLLNTPKAAVYVQGIRDGADRLRPEWPSEVEVRYAGGPTVRVAGFSVTTDAETSTVVVEGFIASRTGQPHSGDAVRLAYLGIPGRGALADITARVELFTRLTVLNIRIRTTIRPEATP